MTLRDGDQSPIGYTGRVICLVLNRSPLLNKPYFLAPVYDDTIRASHLVYFDEGGVYGVTRTSWFEGAHSFVLEDFASGQERTVVHDAGEMSYIVTSNPIQYLDSELS
jgi:hypothetical protein